MKHRFIQIVPLILCMILLCACTQSSQLETNFLPISIGAASAGNNMHVTFGGYEAASDSSQSASYTSRSDIASSILQSFDEKQYPLGMVGSFVAEQQLAQDGLYPLYAPFIYHDDATESMYLCLSPDPSQLLEKEPADFDTINTFLEESHLPAANIINYDIAMRTPYQCCIVPIVDIDKDNQIHITSAAVFSNDQHIATLSQQELVYAKLLSGEKTKLLLPFNLPTYDTGLLELELECAITAQKNELDSFSYQIIITGSGLVASREKTHEQIDLSSDSALLQNAVNAQIEKECRDLLQRAANEIPADVFCFIRCLSFKDYTYAFADPSSIFNQNTDYTIVCETKIFNLTQIH